MRCKMEYSYLDESIMYIKVMACPRARIMASDFFCGSSFNVILSPSIRLSS